MTPAWYSWLATSLRSLAMILPQLPLYYSTILTSTFETICADIHPDEAIHGRMPLHLTTILGSWLLPHPTLPTPWINGYSELRMAGDKHAAKWLIGFLWRNHYRNKLKSTPISLIILAKSWSVKIPNYQSPDSHTRSRIAATMPFPKTNLPMINRNIMQSVHSPSCMNVTNVIIK